jgi:hypothetical protein
VLVLDLRVNQERHGPNSETRVVLRDLAAVVRRQLQNPRCPGSMRALGKIVIDVNSAAEQATRPTQTETQTVTNGPMSPPNGLQATPATSIPYSPRPAGTPSSMHNLLAYPIDPVMQPDMGMQYRGQLFDPNTWSQLSFMDEPGNSSWQDWTWDDIETIVRR